MADWQVRQQVAKVPRWLHESISGPFTITAVKGRKILLEDGSEWTANGRRWGSGTDRWYTGPLIDLWDEERHAAMNAERDRKSAAYAVWDEFKTSRDRLTLEQIAAIRAVLAQGKR